MSLIGGAAGLKERVPWGLLCFQVSLILSLPQNTCVCVCVYSQFIAFMLPKSTGGITESPVLFHRI